MATRFEVVAELRRCILSRPYLQMASNWDMQFLFDPLNHLRPIRACANARAATLSLAPSCFLLQITDAGKTTDLSPRFSVRTPTGLGYTHAMGDKGSFAGWLPYRS